MGKGKKRKLETGDHRFDAIQDTSIVILAGRKNKINVSHDAQIELNAEKKDNLDHDSSFKKRKKKKKKDLVLAVKMDVNVKDSSGKDSSAANKSSKNKKKSRTESQMIEESQSLKVETCSDSKKDKAKVSKSEQTVRNISDAKSEDSNINISKNKNIEITQSRNNKNAKNSTEPSLLGSTGLKRNKPMNEEDDFDQNELDTFCDDLEEEDNKTYLNWVNLLEENFRKKCKDTGVKVKNTNKDKSEFRAEDCKLSSEPKKKKKKVLSHNVVF